eukprot:scaffold436_cov55-Cyclotella_meneghiniana.AAC.7
MPQFLISIAVGVSIQSEERGTRVFMKMKAWQAPLVDMEQWLWWFGGRPSNLRRCAMCTGGGWTPPQNGDHEPPIFPTMARVSGSACALAQVNGVAIYSTYLTYDVIHTCTFYEFLRIQCADIMGGFGRKCALKRHFVRPIITSLVSKASNSLYTICIFVVIV